MTCRINLYGSAGVGKSTLAAYLFYRLKSEGFKAECVWEKAKEFVYTGRKPDHYDNMCWFSRQMRKEQDLIKGGVEYIITDSPLFLKYLYAEYHKSYFAEQCYNICKSYDIKNPSINVLLNHRFNYVQEGRWENYEEAQHKQEFFKSTLKNYCAANKFMYYNPGLLSDERIYQDIKLFIL